MADSQKTSEQLGETQDRRGFIKILAGAIGGLLFLGPMIAGAIPILGPLFRKRETEGGPGFDVRVTSPDQVPQDGKPAAFAIFGEERNVWNYTPSVKVGEVILVRDVVGGGLRAFSPICPHLGCAVQTVKDEDAATDDSAASEDSGDANSPQPPPFEFSCPCHNSAFNLDGTKTIPAAGQQNPSPRGLDELPPPLTPPEGMTATNDKYIFTDAEDTHHVFVRYQEFFTGRSDKVAKDL